jgi:hypothetical protein
MDSREKKGAAASQEVSSQANATPWYDTSGPEIDLPGQIVAGLPPGRHAEICPPANRWADFGAFPLAVQAKSGL